MIIEPLNPESPATQNIIALSDAFMAATYQSERNLFESTEALKLPNVLFLGAFVDGQLVACGAVRTLTHDLTYGEIKRIYVVEEHRGKGLSKAIMQRLEAHLRASGISLARLATGIKQPEALGLYRQLGYLERDPFGAYDSDPLSVFMERPLAA